MSDSSGEPSLVAARAETPAGATSQQLECATGVGPSLSHGVLVAAFVACLVFAADEFPLPGEFSSRIAVFASALVVAACIVQLAGCHPQELMLAGLFAGSCVLPVESPFRAAIYLLLGGLLAGTPRAGLLLGPRWHRLICASTFALGVIVLLRMPVIQRTALTIVRLLPRPPELLGPRAAATVGPEHLLLGGFLFVASTHLFGLASGERRREFIFLALTLALAGAQLLHRSPAIGGIGLGSALLLWSCGGAGGFYARATPHRSADLIVSASLSFVVVAIALRPIPPSSPQNRKIAFLTSEHNSLDFPDAALARVVPAFGAWYTLLQRAGLPACRLDRPIAAGALDDVGCLVLINHSFSLGSDEESAIHSFVDRGGSVLVLADHTNAQGQLSPTNRLLARYGMALRFDSAIPFDDTWSWAGATRTTIHPLSRSLSTLALRGWRVGCSLDVGPGAVPLLVGTLAYSDKGDPTAVREAELGNMDWDVGEQRGGLVLAAESSQSAGRVIVLGDTSPFQDGVLPDSHAELMRIVHYLLGETTERRHFSMAVLVFLGAAWVLVRWFTTRGVQWARAQGMMIGALLGAWTGEVATAFPLPTHEAVWIDASHGNAVRTVERGDEGIGGLLRSFMGDGCIPFVVRDAFAETIARGGRAVVIARPRGQFTESDLRALDRFLFAGGDVWILAGLRDAHACPELLAHFGARLRPTPLAAAEDARILATGEPVELDQAWPLEVSGGESIAGALGTVVVVRKVVGSGRCTIIGDPGIFREGASTQGLGFEMLNRSLYQRLLNPPEDGR